MSAENDKDDYFVNSGGLKIFCKYWQPQLHGDQQIRAAVFICHGVGEHCQVYDHLVAPFTQRGILAFAHDHVGHGLSDGDRVHITDGMTYIKDVVQHVNMIKDKYPGIVLFIIGHSMGGAIALKTALDNQDLFAGVVLIGPAIVADPKLATPFMICLAKSFASLVPQYQIKGINPEYLSHDREVVKKYQEDPLVWHGGLKAKWGVCMLALINELSDRLAEANFPFFALHGTADVLCQPSGSQMLYDQACSTNKKLKMYEGAYHQVHNEPNGQGDEAISDIVNWITSLLS